MKFKFVNDKYPKLASDLTNEEKAQLLICESLYFDAGYTVEQLLDTENEDESFLDLEIWDLVDESDNLVYKVYGYNADSGTLFKANTTEVIGQVIQFGFECEDYEQEKTIGKLLDEAQKINGPKRIEFIDEYDEDEDED